MNKILEKLPVVKRKVLKFFKYFFISFGVFSFILFLLSFSDIPYYAYHSLGTSNSKIFSKPDLIIVLGGSGMPSPDGLIRTYYASEAAQKYPDAEIIIALPFDEEDSLYQLQLMEKEILLKGIDSSRIRFEPWGFNTRSQAVNIASKYKNSISLKSLLIVTSPEHMYRAVKTFKKAGFSKVYGFPTFENPVDPEKVKDKQRAKDIRVKSLSLRYNMWSYLNYELLVMREYCAITYYKLKGWI